MADRPAMGALASGHPPPPTVLNLTAIPAKLMTRPAEPHPDMLTISVPAMLKKAGAQQVLGRAGEGVLKEVRPFR